MSNTKARDHAREVLSHHPLTLDTETTGLGEDAEIIEIGIIDDQGGTVFESLIKPAKPIPEAATAIHGISNADVANAPTWADVHEQVCSAIEHRPIIIYNASYDVRMLLQTADQYQLRLAFFSAWCAMSEYAQWRGEWDGKRDDWKRQRLTTAAQQVGLDLPTDSQAHRAIYDCKLALGVVQSMAE